MSILDLTSWCIDIEEKAHEFGSNMERHYNEPMEYVTSYKETKELAIYDLIRDIKKMNNRDNIINVIVSQEFMDDYNGNGDSNITRFNISSKYMKDLMVLFPNANISTNSNHGV